MTGEAFYLLASAWVLGILAVFIQAIRLSYRVDFTNRSGYARKALIFHIITNTNLARNTETQAIRRRMNLLLLVVVAGFVVMWAGIGLVRSTGV